jgi:hypothetical protein
MPGAGASGVAFPVMERQPGCTAWDGSQPNPLAPPAFERLRRLEGRLLAEGREFLCLCGHHRELLAGVPGRDFEELRRRFHPGQFVG